MQPSLYLSKQEPSTPGPGLLNTGPGPVCQLDIMAPRLTEKAFQQAKVKVLCPIKSLEGKHAGQKSKTQIHDRKKGHKGSEPARGRAQRDGLSDGASQTGKESQVQGEKWEDTPASATKTHIQGHRKKQGKGRDPEWVERLRVGQLMRKVLEMPLGLVQHLPPGSGWGLLKDAVMTETQIPGLGEVSLICRFRK